MYNQPVLWRSSWPREFDRFFERFGLPALRQAEGDRTRYDFSPQFEVEEDKTAYHLKFDLPGIPKDQIKIDLHENSLTVSGERKEEKTADSKTQHFSDVFYGSFSKSINFPNTVDAEKVTASYENGILSISIPKSETTRSRQINIK